MSARPTKKKGCFQCSQRRIVCDNTEPVCIKCQRKGIECSGSGRIRFSTGVARRGKLKGCIIPVADVSPEAALETQTQVATVVPRTIRWKADQLGHARSKKAKQRAQREEGRTQTSAVPPAKKSAIDTDTNISSELDRHNMENGCFNIHVQSQLRLGEAQPTDEPTEQTMDLDLVPVSVSPGPIHPWIAPLSPQSRMLMSHFAHQVAPVMVVLDDVANGYRDVLLPLACEDDLLRTAVGVAASQHLALNDPRFQSVADKGRAAIISRLRRESLQASPDQVFNLSTWATLIVLLVGETITGSSEYSHLLQTLMCLIHSIGKIAPSAARDFLLQQTHMFEFLGQPLLGETHGVQALRLPLDRYLDWTYYDLPSDSPHHHLLHVSRMAFIKASQIYLGRVSSTRDQCDLLEDLKQLVSQINPDQMGSHALVWVYFIAAADSADPEHRRFFVDRMNQVFSKTKFHNISAGIQSLPAIWSHQGSGRWTQNLARLAPSLIM